MPKLAIIATIEITRGRIDDYVPLAIAHRARCLKDEPGTLAFEILRPRYGDSKVLLYELYADDAAFEAHWNGPSIKRVREEAEAAGITMKISGTRCTPVD
jgi:(4S)-4-hydroxy-5-phosphonooxypentane-2,3-dione isomerase